MSYQQVILVGHLGSDPEVRYMPDGRAVVNFSLATSEKWTDKASGEQKESTEWHKVVVYGKPAEIAGQQLRKGSKVTITNGKLKTRKWRDKSGQDRYTTEIIAPWVDFERFESNGKRSETPQQPKSEQKTAKDAGFGASDDDDIPF